MKLSILIPTVHDRQDFLNRLRLELSRQIAEYNAIDRIEVLVFADKKQYSIGFKRNWLMNNCKADYIAFFDDDDRPGDNYIKHALEGISLGADACGLTGIITEDGLNPKKFVHSFKYDHWFEKDNVYYRNTNHLNVIKRSIAIQMKFPEVNQGEDHSYSKQLYESGLITSEYWDENEVIYYYDYRSKK